MTVREFSRHTLYAVDQRAVLGAVIMPLSHAYPPLDMRAYGIQFIRPDLQILDELRARDVRQIYFAKHPDLPRSEIITLDFDDN